MILPLLLLTLSPCFQSPDCWKFTDPKHSDVAFIAPVEKGFAPSINLTTEKIDVTPEKYIDAVESLISKNKAYRRLGTIETKAGTAFLAQIENTSSSTVSLQSIVVRDRVAYIMTGIAKKKDFPKCRRAFMKAFTSFSLLENLLDFVSEKERRDALTSYNGDLKQFLTNNYQDEGLYWQLLMLSSKS